MEERQPITDSTELLHRIGRLSSEAAWTTEELQDALREGGMDPGRLVHRVMTDVKRLLNTSDEHLHPEDRDRVETPRPLLVALREHTRLPPSAIADAIEVPVPFLSVVSRHPTAVPAPWRTELATRAERTLQVDRRIVMASFDTPFQYDMAASRDTPYATDTVRNYADILDRSGMSPEARRFWRALAADEAS